MKRKTSWQEKLADNKDLPRVEKIDQKKSKRWGTGTFVIPAPIEVDAIMAKVPKGKLITINEIRQILAKRHKATIGCPITTGIFSWIAANELFRRGISDLKPLAYVEKARIGLLKESFFLMESPVDYLEMDRYLIKSFGNGQSRDLITKKRIFIQQFAQYIGRLHQSEIFHGDLKACNILARERTGAWDFSFIDLDAVRLATEVNSRKALKNLVQINCSIPGFLSYADRMRFLKWYLEMHPIPMRKRDLIKAVLEESRKRGVLHVSPEGDVTEGVLAR